MLFYCPNCQKEVETQEVGRIVTKSGRVAHKAKCPTCGTDMTEFVPGEKTTPPVDTSAVPAAGVPQPSVDAAAGVPQPSVETAAAPAATAAVPTADKPPVVS